MGRSARGTASSALLALLPALLSAAPVHAAPDRPEPAVAETVYFPSDDGRTRLVGYLFRPDGEGPHPAVVMLHGRSGPYSSRVSAACTVVAEGQPSVCGESSLSARHRMWGAYWAAHGYLALLVDSFGPRGRAHGYGRHSHEDPDRDAVNEIGVRPLDAEGGLRWLTARPDVIASKIALQGWSNGGSTALNAMYRQATGARSVTPATAAAAGRFRAALVFYPGCGPRALISQRYRADRGLQVFLGGDDEEVSPVVCARILHRAEGGPVEVTEYAGATHDFDDPGAARQAVAANQAAKEDATRRSLAALDALD